MSKKLLVPLVPLMTVMGAVMVSGAARAQEGASPALSTPLSEGPAVEGTPTNAPSGVSLSDVPADYHLDTDDTVSIGVTRHGDVGGSFRIPPDGLLRLPRLLTPVSARGKTCADLVTEITGKLVTEGKLVLRPGQVSVALVGVRTRRVFVRGNAIHGGDYDLKNGWRIADFVAILGAVPQPDRVKARLTSPRRTTPVDIDLSTALADARSPANMLLQEGDTLTLDLPHKKRLLVTGEGPRGEKEFDDWVGLKRALQSIGYSATGASGDLARAQIIRYATPGDLTTKATYYPVDLQKLLTDDSAREVPFDDQDTLDIPLSDKFVMITGEIGGPPRKWYLPQDRKTYLIDVFTATGDVGGRARTGGIKIFRKDATGEWKPKEYDLGKFVSKADTSQNPQILPQDMIYVPTNNRQDPVSNVWTAFGLYNIVKVFVPGLR